MNFAQIADGIDVAPVLAELDAHPELWGQVPYRKIAAGTPHGEMDDIWVRYNDIRPHDAAGNYSRLNDPHIPIWYPAAAHLPSLRPILFGLMAAVQGEMLGAVLITRLPAGGKIEPHVDSGWHAGYFDKFYVPLRNESGSVFCWHDGEIAAKVGSAWWFRNDVPHWVHNNSAFERIAMIVCIRREVPHV